MHAILTFHSIDDSGSVLSYPVTMFEDLLKILHSRHIPILDLPSLLKPETTKGVALTFDDGMRSVLTDALPILKQFDATAHVYVTTDLIGREKPWPDAGESGQFEMLGWDEVELLHKSGVVIEAHTRSHPDMRELSIDQLRDECEESNTVIERKTGRRPANFAYPFGFHNSAARKVVRELYSSAATTELNFLQAGLDHTALPRIDSYYLQNRVTRKLLGTMIGEGYFKVRSLMRNMAGTQCTPDA